MKSGGDLAVAMLGGIRCRLCVQPGTDVLGILSRPCGTYRDNPPDPASLTLLDPGDSATALVWY